METPSLERDTQVSSGRMKVLMMLWSVAFRFKGRDRST